LYARPATTREKVEGYFVSDYTVHSDGLDRDRKVLVPVRKVSKLCLPRECLRKGIIIWKSRLSWLLLKPRKSYS